MTVSRMRGQTMRFVGIRILLIISLPFCIILAFFTRFFREVGSAFWFARNDVRMEISSARRVWREAHNIRIRQ